MGPSRGSPILRLKAQALRCKGLYFFIIVNQKSIGIRTNLGGAITSLSARGGFYAFSDTKTMTSGAGAGVTINSNLPIGTYLLLVQSDANISDSSIMALEMSSGSGMTMVGGLTVRGTMISGGGLVNFAVITVTNTTNSFVVSGYGYASSSFTQRFRAYCIRLT